MHPDDMRAQGIQPGDVATVASRRGTISLFVRQDAGIPRGAVFIPFAFYEAAANILTNPVLDPFGKIPEFKYCAVNVTRGGEHPADPGYGKGRSLKELQT
jgi:formate dehydrogenase major subunit